ncbi:MAG: hypothetical protein WCK83_00115 [Burkholderiales bacterium]
MTTAQPTWRFFRAGGFDQVRLETAAELLALPELDQKLWVALSCPVKGIEFDARTLALVDTDGDGQVRAPELIAALQWAAARLKSPDVLVHQLAGVPLQAIRDDDEVGQRIAAAAQDVLADAGSADGLVTVDAASAAQARFAQRALAAWEAAGAQAQTLGAATQAAHAALVAVADKVDDWFVRSRMVAFDARAGAALNASTEALAALGTATLSPGSDTIAALPLAQVTADAVLPLVDGVNPAWAQRLAALRADVALPVLGERTALTESDWSALKTALAPYAAWLASQPDPTAQGEGVRDLEQLARYVRDLQSLANNFVAFRDFYTRQGPATFQVGTLYLDGRSCDLCVAVNDAARHAALATLARICLVYVECVRATEKMTVAAAFTAGDSDQLMVGRNGVFYDRQGRDWSATVTKIVEHPISLRQAFWSPYKRLSRMLGEQFQKFAASKSAVADGQLASAAAQVSARATSSVKPGSAPVAAFDVAKFAGIFAAIGLAIGAIGTLLASLVSGLIALKWWQLPLALVGLMLVISAPAVLLAWFKLRSRTLGPLLDANGWAINARARINIPFGTALTQTAQLPPNAQRSLVDPYAEKKKPWWLLALALAACLGLAWKLGWF